jgi:hypothetical protein
MLLMLPVVITFAFYFHVMCLLLTFQTLATMLAL